MCTQEHRDWAGGKVGREKYRHLQKYQASSRSVFGFIVTRGNMNMQLKKGELETDHPNLTLSYIQAKLFWVFVVVIFLFISDKTKKE